QGFQDCQALLSVDTRKSPVMRQAAAAGAGLINDVTALSFSDDSLQTVSELALPVCLMHSQGTPQTMQDDPRYDDVVLDVYDYLAGRIDVCVAAGIDRDQIIIDPGIGFGKTVRHNLALIDEIAMFHGLGVPILLGASRKSFIGVAAKNAGVGNRLPGSLAVALAGARAGVQILRVHDVAETKQALAVSMSVEHHGFC
ncbi:MAG TPA: dihydropteroate synthase, partial [Rhizobiales bacterium]|nr:dihydropteroate synthase [Hyphomicrobiales bacterium]